MSKFPNFEIGQKVTNDEEWIVICPSKLEKHFKDISKVKTFEHLDLNVSLRSHLADDISSWVSFY